MPLVKNTYKFHLSSDKIKLNKQRYQELVNDKFYTCIGENHGQDENGKPDGRWYHPLLFEIIRAQWFASANSNDVTFMDKWENEQIPLTTVALVYTAVA
ncbi:hypothetical protein FRC03_001903 [Tulasnella sp. 419]|nr:hypothetical protein FRC03_001903 [Tulasnella sp. 419]